MNTQIMLMKIECLHICDTHAKKSFTECLMFDLGLKNELGFAYLVDSMGIENIPHKKYM